MADIPNTRLSVLHIVASINRDVGGPAITVPALASVLAARGVDTTIATLDYARHGPRSDAGGARVVAQPASALTRMLRGWSPAFERRVGELAREGTGIVHGHGLWMFPNLYARRAAAAAGRPLIVSPRGMLDEWSMRRNRARKLVAWQLIERGNLAAAKLLHATSSAEAQAIREVGCAQPVAVVSNGVDVPDPACLPGREVLERAWPALAGKQWLLFMSRLHPKKGVLELVRAWGALERRFPGWQLVIAGPELDGYGGEVRALAAATGVAGRIVFPGVLSGEAKACALARAALFVLPTHAENFGVVIAEALAHGTPAMTTKAAPWAELQRARCGWWIEDSEEALRAALDRALALAAGERREMGVRGRKLVQERYSWAGAADEMLAVYRWILGAGQKPACVHTLES